MSGIDWKSSWNLVALSKLKSLETLIMKGFLSFVNWPLCSTFGCLASSMPSCTKCFYMGKLFSLNAFKFKASIWICSCLRLKISSIKKREKGYKFRVVNEGDIFPSVTESREMTISRVVEQLVPERKRK